MYCAKCGNKNIDDASFCISCGSDLKRQTPAERKNGADTLDSGATGVNTELPEVDLSIGSLFADRYEILDTGKAGGMGAVYRCRDIKFNETVALKIIHSRLLSSPAALTRFCHEVAISRKFHHDHIVRVYNLENWQGMEYFTMEWIKGGTLRDILDRRKSEGRPFSLEEASIVISQLASALEYAHQFTVHRDIKPENILIESSQEHQEVISKSISIKLTDFGIAKMLSPSKFTTTSINMGTPYYMAPEQKLDAGNVDKRADIYAMGVLLFEFFTLNNTIGLELPSELNSDLPAEIDMVLKKALVSKPEGRYACAQELALALENIDAGSVIATSNEIEAVADRTPPVRNIAPPSEPQQETPESDLPESPLPKRNLMPYYAALAVLILITSIYLYNRSGEDSQISEQSRVNQKAEAEILSTQENEAEEKQKEELTRMAIDEQVDELARRAEERLEVELARKAEQARQADEKRKADLTRKTEQAQARLEEEKRKADSARKAEQEQVRLEEEIRSADLALKAVQEQPAKKASQAEEKSSVALTGQIREEKKSEPVKLPLSNQHAEDMISIKGRCFKMGSGFWLRYEDEKPAHDVCLDDFLIGKYETTQGQWKEIMGMNPSGFKDCGDSCPVENVSWNEVKEFIEKLNQKTGKEYRLPTEAEWEYAARASQIKWDWSGTDDETKIADYAWYGMNSQWKTHPVGQKEPNTFGLYDMTGNVYEWVSDWYDKEYYKKSPRMNPKGADSGGFRVMRGGSWVSEPKDLYVYNRGQSFPDIRFNSTGFRLAASVSK